jgi:hypothetical protein
MTFGAAEIVQLVLSSTNHPVLKPKMANCDVCQGLNPETPAQKPQSIELRISAIIQRARMGCSSCFVLQKGLEHCICFKLESDTTVRIVRIRPGSTGRAHDGGFFAEVKERKGGCWFDVEFHVIKGMSQS